MIASINGHIYNVKEPKNIKAIPFTILPLPNVPIFSNNPQNTLCAGQAIGINGAGASQYQLYVNGNPFGPQQATPSFNPVLPVGANQLSIQGVGANSCVSSSPTLNVQVNPIPVITLQSSDFDNIFCLGDTVTITASGANQFQFYLNGASQGSLSNTNTYSSNNFTNGTTCFTSNNLTNSKISVSRITLINFALCYTVY